MKHHENTPLHTTRPHRSQDLASSLIFMPFRTFRHVSACIAGGGHTKERTLFQRVGRRISPLSGKAKANLHFRYREGITHFRTRVSESVPKNLACCIAATINLRARANRPGDWGGHVCTVMERSINGSTTVDHVLYRIQAAGSDHATCECRCAQADDAHGARAF